MDDWPKSWAGIPDDETLGHGLVLSMRSFLTHLIGDGLSPKTLRRHWHGLWVIGGEIIRAVHADDALRQHPPRQLLRDAIDHGQAPVVCGATEADQRSFDATARRLLRFLSANS
jgi:hypothetical protein